MLKWMFAVLGLLSLIGCAHHGAVRVNCDGVLRPVNSPIEAQAPSVSVAPKDPEVVTEPVRQP